MEGPDWTFPTLQLSGARCRQTESSGKLSFDDIISHEFPLADINAALDLVRRGKAGPVLVAVHG